MSQAPPDRAVVELVVLEFRDTTYRRKSTPAGQARKAAFKAFADAVLPHNDMGYASSSEDPCKVVVMSTWPTGTYDPENSTRTIVKPLSEHLVHEDAWSRLLFVPDDSSQRLSQLSFSGEVFDIRVLHFQTQPQKDAAGSESVKAQGGIWTERERQMADALQLFKRTVFSDMAHEPKPASIQRLKFAGLMGGWVVDPATEGSDRKFVLVLGWGSREGEQEAWGQGEDSKGMESLLAIPALADGVEHHWRTDKFKRVSMPGDKYHFSSSDEDF